MKKSILFSLIFVVLSTLSYLILEYEKDKKIEQYLNTKTKQYTQSYDALYHEYKQLSEVIFKTKINTKEVLTIFKNRDRDKLYLYLKDTYSLLKQQQIKQLHFHLPSNDSFLRYHRPNKYGDNLADIRATVKYVNESKKPIDGFEEGRVSSGYRFVFPLFYEKEHIGSVEVSFSTFAIHKEFMASYHVISNSLVSKNIVDEKVFKSEKSNYIQSPFENYYLKKSVLTYIKNNIQEKIIMPVSETTKSIIDNNIIEKDSFSIYDTLRKEVMTFIKIRNPISKKHVGFFVIKSDNNYIIDKTNNFYIFLSLVIIFIASVLIFIFKDIAYKKKIKLNHSKLQTILNEADSGIGVIDLDGNFLEVNHAYCKLLGYSKEELLNINCLDISSKDTKEKAKQIIEEAKQKGRISKARKECISKQGELIHIELSLTLLPSGKEFIAVITSLEDKLQLEHLNSNLQEEVDKTVKSLKIKNSLLSQQSKMAAIGGMIDSIAHQWMQPIGVIRMKLQMLELDLELNQVTDEKILDTTQGGEDQIKHLIDTINEFRAFFRPNSKVVETPLKVIIDASILLMQDNLIKNSININVTGDTTAVVKVNSNEFKHVIINIVNNAKDAFNDNNIDKQKRSLIFNIEKIEDKTVFTITDKAGGIPEDIINHIFEPNFTTKDKRKGTGIGLYMTKQIIEKIGATIEVENIDNGASFKITI